ncbi:MAG: amidohydrolase family protein [Acidimicrobiaceae bacterium]|nr:amidohydrolase family protein [Acidimicrobiaceae bacterium]
MVTLAPELSGALDAIRFLVREGVVAAIGHTDATYEETRSAIDAGASVATHLGNGMPSLFARQPGPLLALMESPKVSCELIADGRHVHPCLVRYFVNHAISGVPIFVSDCLGVEGEGKHIALVSDRLVEMDDGAVVFKDNGKLAGTALPLSGILKSSVTKAGIDLITAVSAATIGPARTIGLEDRGKIETGYRADLVLLNGTSLDVARVMRCGNWVVEKHEYE